MDDTEFSWPLGARKQRYISRSGVRNGCSSALGAAGAPPNGCSSPPRSRRGARNGRWSPPRGHRGARNACSASLGRAKSLPRLARPRRSAQIQRSKWLLGLAGALEIAAQAQSDEETCEKTIRKRCARVATRSEHLALFVYAPCMDPLGSARIYIYIYIGGLGEIERLVRPP